ncbi:hypothetical protein [Tautonia plasticadhaerens]|uniref:Uncharacterized protein n=1 Tax=Tautonia plasticadhaerens TaxID=2527974 RepID=A0A518GZU1_9BACT|nr:hypothetical protein [Tautonia plasticadhaerens]QDV34100.1 hypothetical protein ElP_19820 [Tautonia plasticadhaerens]
MNRDDLARLVLIEVQQRCEAIRSRPRPPQWKCWSVLKHDLDVAHGPCYSPRWFGDASATEAGRVRLLRAVYRLADSGLLTIVKSEGGRLERVRLTASGDEAATELRNAETQSRAAT